MATATTAEPATTTAPKTYLWDSTGVPLTLSTRTVPSSRRTTPAICSLYSESWYGAATSYYRVDAKPTICGGSTQYSAYPSPTGRPINDVLSEQADARSRKLDRRIEVKLIVLAVVGGLMALTLIASIVMLIRKRRKQREQDGLLAANNFQQRHGAPSSLGPEMAKEVQGQERGVIDRRMAQ